MFQNVEQKASEVAECKDILDRVKEVLGKRENALKLYIVVGTRRYLFYRVKI